MKKYIVFLSLIIFFSSCTTNKKAISKMPIRCITTIDNYKDSIVTLPVLSIIDTNIYSVLDNIIDLNSKCIHVSMGELTWFKACWVNENDTLTFCLHAYQYTNSTITRITEDEAGCFYYRNCLFVYSNPKKNTPIFFKKTGEMKNIVTYYPNAKAYLFKDCNNCYPLDQLSWITYYYINNQFLLKKSYSTCIEYYPVFHQIHKGDNLSKISKMYWVKPEQIMKLNNLNDTILPSKGEIRIQ